MFLAATHGNDRNETSRSRNHNTFFFSGYKMQFTKNIHISANSIFIATLKKDGADLILILPTIKSGAKEF